MIDDFRASGVSSTASVSDTNIPDGLDSLLAMCSAYQRLVRGRRVLVCSVDFSHAYKNIPPPVEQEHFASIIFPNKEGEPLVGRLRTQPLGSSRAPANWGRVAEFIKFLLVGFFLGSPFGLR